ncbi:MAG TPA: hypothetical protein PLE77_04745 [Kiritimatiellia bacterium]|nr:hypothetical protein [Kiritimatiellia bacterium]
MTDTISIAMAMLLGAMIGASLQSTRWTRRIRQLQTERAALTCDRAYFKSLSHLLSAKATAQEQRIQQIGNQNE